MKKHLVMFSVESLYFIGH